MKSIIILLIVVACISTVSCVQVLALGVWPGLKDNTIAPAVHFILGSGRNYDCSPSFDVGKPIMLNSQCRQDSPRAMLGGVKKWLRTRPNGGMCAQIDKNSNIVYWEWCDRKNDYPGWEVHGSLLRYNGKCLTTSKEGIAVLGTCA